MQEGMEGPVPCGLPLPCVGYGGYSAEAIMEHCKITTCYKRQQHDWTVCFYSHPGEKACRRDLRVHSYAAVMCSERLHKGSCPRGDACPQSHNVFEYHMHPARFRTKLCSDGDKCRRPFCFFAHGLQQLRQPTTASNNTSRPSPRRPAAAAGCSSGNSGNLVHVLSAPPLLGAGMTSASDSTAVAAAAAGRCGLDLRADSGNFPVRCSMDSRSSGTCSSRSSGRFCTGVSPLMLSPTPAAHCSSSGPTGVIGLVPGSRTSIMSPAQGSFVSVTGRQPIALQSQDSSSATSLGSAMSCRSSTAMQIDRQLSWQLQLQAQGQQQQQQKAQMQAQQQQQQMLQLQQMESMASAAVQQLTSLKLELQQRQQRQQAHEAQLLAAMVTSGLPVTSLEVSNALRAQLPLSADMMGVDGSVLYVQNASAAGLLDPAFVGIGSSNLALGGSSSSTLGGAGVMLPSPTAAGAVAGGVGLAGVSLDAAQLPQGSQCYQVVQDATAAADSCMIVSEGLLLQQQQQQLMAAGGLM